jgi:hypothetical protein
MREWRRIMNEYGFEWLSFPRIIDEFEIEPMCNDFVCDRGDFVCSQPGGFKGCKKDYNYKCNGHQKKDR